MNDKQDQFTRGDGAAPAPANQSSTAADVPANQPAKEESFDMQPAEDTPANQSAEDVSVNRPAPTDGADEKAGEVTPSRQKTAENAKKMGVMPVGKLIFRMSAPAMISMLVQALYNVVDSIFVSAIGGVTGAKALDAMSYAFPLQMLYMAFALGIGVGSNSLISRYLGEGDRYSANKVAITGLVVSLFHCAVFMIIGATLMGPVAGLFTSDAQTAAMVAEYMSICLIFSGGCFAEIFINKVNQSMSKMTVPMISQLIGAIVNIILDPVFILKFGMGVKGAAIATVIGQWCALIFTAITFFVRKSDVALNFKYLRLKGRTIASIYRIGLPTIILNAVSSFTIMLMYEIFNRFEGAGNGSVTILGVYFKVQSFVFMPCFGLNQGILPILAYNYGANKKPRFVRAYATAVTVALIIMAAGLAVFQFGSGLILGLFRSIAENPDLLAKAIRAFRIISVCFIPAGLSVITITMFQSIGYGFSSMLMSVLRQLVILLPVAYLLCRFASAAYVWWAYPIAEVAVIAVFLPIALATIKKVFIKKDLALRQTETAAAGETAPLLTDTAAGETAPLRSSAAGEKEE